MTECSTINEQVAETKQHSSYLRCILFTMLLQNYPMWNAIFYFCSSVPNMVLPCCQMSFLTHVLGNVTCHRAKCATGQESIYGLFLRNSVNSLLLTHQNIMQILYVWNILIRKSNLYETEAKVPLSAMISVLIYAKVPLSVIISVNLC